MINLDFENKILATKGKLLLSEPFMTEDYFSRAVVMLTEHSDQNGSVGFILNKPTDVKISELLPDFKAFDAPVFIGGPVNADNVFYIHTLGEKLNEAVHITGKLYWGGNFEQLCNLAEKGEVSFSQIRFFAGYAGWNPGQLNKELKEKSWIVSSLSNKIDIFHTDVKNMWSNVLKHMGKEFELLSNFPLNPQDN